jgi:hypothetical protein
MFLRTIRTIITARNDSFRKQCNVLGDLARSITAGVNRNSGLSVHPAVPRQTIPDTGAASKQSNDFCA